MKKKPLIAITPVWNSKTPWNHEAAIYWLRDGYMKVIQAAGAIPVMLPVQLSEADMDQVATDFDGFLFSGGDDVDPVHYGEKPLPACGAPNPLRDALELSFFKVAQASGKPIFGICRGFQVINIARGGSLYQDIPTQIPSELKHTADPSVEIPTHGINIVPDSPLHKLVGSEQFTVNSFHHQAIKDLAPGLVSMATATDGVTEAIYDPLHPFLWAVQWHPEMLPDDPTSQKLLKAFIAACE